MMTALRRANLFFAVVVVLPTMVHVLELPNKLALDGALWLAVQQHLYRGWGPFLGGPAEIGALATTLLVTVMRRRCRRAWLPSLFAAAIYAAMIVVFFVFNAPVNRAVDSWTEATLPADWPAYRLQWEAGHALAGLLGWLGLAALVRARMIERSAGGRSDR